MWIVAVLVAIFVVGFFMWSKAAYKKRNREAEKRKNKPPFLTEDDLPEYGKKLKDNEYNPVDMDDAE